MLTNRAARGAAGLLAGVLLGSALGACSGPSAVTTATPTATTGAGTSSAAAPTTAATTAPATTRPASRTTTPEDSSTRTVYAGPSRTSTLVPWDEPSVSAGAGGPTPSAPAGAARLTILLDDGFGIRATWTLTCSPAGGTHPHPAVACGVLGANGARALPAAPATGCAEQYGGPQKALVTGTWRGAAVRSQFTLENACEIRRWTAMIGLLPPGGV